MSVSCRPLYPFGYGLSYTNFTYGKPTLDHGSIGRAGMAKISVDVTNTGKRAGAEVVQFYMHPRFSSTVQPVLRLAGYRRIQLAAGATTTVTFDVGAEQLSVLDRALHQVVEPGVFDIAIGPNAAATTAVALTVTP